MGVRIRGRGGGKGRCRLRSAPLPQLLQRRLGHCGESDPYWMRRAVEGGAGELAGGRRVTGEHDELDLAVRAEVIEDLG